MSDESIPVSVELKWHHDVLCGCWLMGTVFAIVSLSLLLQIPGMLLALSISCFVAGLISAIDEPTAMLERGSK